MKENDAHASDYETWEMWSDSSKRGRLKFYHCSVCLSVLKPSEFNSLSLRGQFCAKSGLRTIIQTPGTKWIAAKQRRNLPQKWTATWHVVVAVLLACTTMTSDINQVRKVVWNNHTCADDLRWCSVPWRTPSTRNNKGCHESNNAVM